MTTTELATQNNSLAKTEALTIKGLFNRDDVKQKFQELLGKRATSFITSVLQIVANNALLSKADPSSIYQSAAVAATLDLPLNNNLGFAYIVPYNAKQSDGSYKQVAQFQLGYRGLIQLAQRSGQFETINSTDVREGEIKEFNRLTGEIIFEWNQTSEREKLKVVGFVAYFKLLNGFGKSFYMTVDELKNHGTKYSQTFKKGFGLWKDDFEAMASKTVLKLLLAKFGPLSVDIQRAVITDQSVVNNSETLDVSYVDHTLVETDKEAERIYLLIQNAKNKKELKEIEKDVPDELLDVYNSRLEELK